MGTYIYVLDEFREVNIDTSLAESLVSRPLELFKVVEDKIRDVTGEIESIRLGKVYADENTGEFVVEYLVKVRYGRLSVKLIHSKNPVEVLRRFYEQEMRERRNPRAKQV